MTKKIPDNARLVFEGVLHDVYQWDQEMFDGSTAIFEAIKRQDGVTVVATVEEKILLNHEEQPNLSAFVAMPGGMSEKESTFLENAQRELKEETGYESTDWEEWFTTDILGSSKMEYNNYVFIARGAEKTSDTHLDSGERIETQLISFDEFLELRHNPTFRNKELIPILEKASLDEQSSRELKEFLFSSDRKSAA